MKKIFILCIGALLILIACGSKLDGTYNNSEMSVTVSEDSNDATMHLDYLENDGGIFGVEKNDGNVKGHVDKSKKTMTFNMEEGDIKFDYKVKGDKLILQNPDKSDEKFELSKE